jgi:hypothetical protein
MFLPSFGSSGTGMPMLTPGIGPATVGASAFLLFSMLVHADQNISDSTTQHRDAVRNGILLYRSERSRVSAGGLGTSGKSGVRE